MRKLVKAFNVGEHSCSILAEDIDFDFEETVCCLGACVMPNSAPIGNSAIWSSAALCGIIKAFQPIFEGSPYVCKAILTAMQMHSCIMQGRPHNELHQLRQFALNGQLIPYQRHG